MKRWNIPFNRPSLSPRTIDAVQGIFAAGKLSGDGAACKRVERRLESLFGAGHALLTTSCTHALEMAAMIVRLKQGDEVILPSFTFVSTANAILRAGGKPVFCDLDERTLTVDPADLERRITPRTRAVVAVHYAGVSAEMDAVLELAERHRLLVIEDAAQGVNAKYREKFLGTIGHCGAYSFHDTKNYTSGEGGAFLTNSEEISREAEIIREKGTNRSNFLRGEVDRYTWIGLGSSYVLSDILASILDCQLDDLERIQQRRREIHLRYESGLGELAARGILRLPVIPPHCASNYHIFYVLVRNQDRRDALIASLKERGIQTTFHYIPLHSSPFARESLGTGELRLPATEQAAGRLLRLPIYPDLTNEEVDYIIEQLNALAGKG